ncbi:MAG: DMT family transporter, partial [Planctomycetota bacterium]
MTPESPLNQKQAVGYLVLAALLWSTGGVLIKPISLNPPAVAGLRSAISFLCLGYLCRKVPFQWSGTLFGASIAYASTVFFFVLGIKWTTVANTCLLQYTAPIYVALFSHWFLGEPTQKQDWITIGVVFFGILLFFLDRLSFNGILGNCCALISGVSLAWVTLLLRKQKNTSSLPSLVLGNLLCTVVCLPFMFEAMPTSRDWIFLSLLGTFQLGLSYYFYGQALKYVRAIEGILIPIIAPILNPMWAWIFLDEIPGFWSFCGGSVVFVTVTFRSMMLLKTQKKSNTENSL